MMSGRAPSQRSGTVWSRHTAASGRSGTVWSRHTAASGPSVVADPLAPKRVCFYKSGDPQFSGFRAVVSGRTFKSFDALLDGLSKKVPLAFGVRTITTPRGTHAVLSLEDLEDGKSYLCSDRKTVKPIDLEAARRRPLPWNSALPASRGRRASQPAGGRAKRGSLAVQPTPKTLTVYRNGDPSISHTVILQATSSLTFDTLLGHVSDLLQVPVVKLFSPDGRRVDSLAALLFCSAVVASSGHEPFRPDSYGPHKPPRTSQSARHLGQPRPRKSKSLSRKNSRNFSPSSETLLVNQINDSMSGSLFKPHSGSTVDTSGLAYAGDMVGLPCSGDTAGLASAGDMAGLPFSGDTAGLPCSGDTAGLASAGARGISQAGSGALLPPGVDDIEKSCRINQDGSMTVEMKVRLMIKEEETIHWTTTLSRSSTTCWPGEGPTPQEPTDERSPNSNSPMEDPDDDRGRGGTKVQLPMPVAGARDPSEEGEDGDAVLVDVEKPRIRRVQTPGPRALRKRPPCAASSLSDAEAQEDGVGVTHSHTERTAGSTAASLSSLTQQHSGRPTPKHRSAAAAANHSELRSAFRTSRSAEVLQIQDNGREVTESVLRVYEQQSCFDGYFCSAKITGEHQSVSRTVRSRTFSTDTAPRSPGKDNGRLHGGPGVTLDSPHCGESDRTATSPEPAVPSHGIQNSPSSFTGDEARVTVESSSECSLRDTDSSESHGLSRGRKNSSEKLKVRKKSSTLSLISGKSLAEGVKVDLRGVRHVKSASDVVQNRKADGVRAERGAEHEQGQVRKMKKKGMRDSDDLSKSSTLLMNVKHQRESAKELNFTEGKSITETTLNLSTFAKKNLLDIQPPLVLRKMLVKQWSMNEERKGARETGEMSESVSMPVLHSSPSAVSEYVGNWLEKMTPHDVTSCAADASGSDSEERVQFQIGCDSCEESEAKSAMKSAPKERLTSEHVAERLSSHPQTEGRIQLGPERELHMRRNTGMSKSHVCIKPTVEGPKGKKHKSAEALVQSGMEMPLAAEAAQEHQIKPLLEQLCSSIQSINQISQRGHTPCLETSHSVPDFPSLVASIFGSSSKMLIAFLSVLFLKEVIANLGRDLSPVKDLSVSEALQMVKALHKLASLENTDELQTGLADLHRSASSALLQSWRSFQELGSLADSQEDAGSSEHPTLSEESSHQEGYPYGFQELMKELDISSDLQRELSGLVMGEMMNDVDRNEEPMEKSEEASSLFESETKENSLVESVQGIGDSDFAQSVAEDEVTDIVQSLSGEVHDFTPSDMEKEINSPEESILEEKDNDSALSFREKEADKLEESVLVEEDDSQATQGRHMNDHELFLRGNHINGSVSVEYESTEDDITRNYVPTISVPSNADTEKCKHSTLEEASYLEEKGSHTGEPVISVGQEKESTYRQMEARFLQMSTVSEAFQLSSTGQSKKGESVVGGSEVRVTIAKLHTGSEEHGDPNSAAISHSVEIPEDLLEYVRSVLLSSSLVFSYDSRGHLRVEPEGPCDGSVKGAPQYGQKQLLSPSMSDLSDYRETSESDRCSSRPSVELTSESEGEGSGAQSITQGSVDRSEGGNDTDLEEVKEYQASSHSSYSDGRTEETEGASQGQSPKRATPCMDDDANDGVLIDKGRWLLKENHLIRKSPPVPSGMYGNVETTSADTTLDDVSEDIPRCAQPGSHRSPMAVLSSSELEELAGPAMPKCSYFNMSHGSDSEPFQDELSDGSRRGLNGRGGGNERATRTKKGPGVSASDEHHQTRAKKCGSLSSFASLEFKMADNKVHPQAGLSRGDPVESQPGGASNAASQTLKEQDSLEKLHLVCGQHCPIL